MMCDYRDENCQVFVGAFDSGWRAHGAWATVATPMGGPRKSFDERASPAETLCGNCEVRRRRRRPTVRS